MKIIRSSLCGRILTAATFFLVSATLWATDSIRLETETFRYEIGADGQILAFFDKVGGKDYYKAPEAVSLAKKARDETNAKRKEGANNSKIAKGSDDPAVVGACAYVTVGEKRFPVTSVSFNDNVLRFTFAGTSITADVNVTAEKGRLIFEVGDVTGEPDEFAFINVPLTLEAKPYEPFAACALALNPITHVHQLPALHDAYWAEATKRFGLIGAKAAMIGVAQEDVLATIRETMTTDAEEIPFSDKGGAWALMSEDGYGSYLMNFGSLTEETVDSWIESCRRLGFTQIDNHGGGFFHFGSLDCQLPGGWESFKRVIDRCHAAGIKVLLHTYTCYINQNARYVTPIPHPDLDTWTDWTLAEPISEDATEITVNEPIDASTETGYMSASNRTVRVGNEIIQYSDVTKAAPWKFTGCVRGFHGTNISAHEAGVKASLLKTFWSGLYIPKPNSPLWDEIAKNHADVINQCGFDGIYFDAIEGLQYMWGRENYWYYGGKFVMDVAKNLKRPVGMEFAGMIHNWWHYRSRYQAWDLGSRGYKRFIDIHFGSMKAGDEYQHGCWLGHDPEIDQFAGMKEGGLYLPFQIGWWGFGTWGHPKAESLYRDDIDYIGTKLVGNNSGFSFNQGADVAWIDSDPFIGDCVELLRQYEEVRHAKIFDESICAELRQPKKEFKLAKDADGNWFFKRMFYKKHKVEGVAHPTANWTMVNEFDDQPLQARIIPFYSLAAYDDPEKAVRFDGDKLAAPGECEGNNGVTGEIRPNAAKVPATGENAFEFTATNDGTVPTDAAWIHTPTFKAPAEVKAEEKLAMGVWICGDGQGEVLNFMTGCCSQLVPIDFVGWKYVELLEADSTAVSHYVWPPINYSVYSHYSSAGALDEFRLWFNNIPQGKRVKCLIGPVTALPYRNNEFRNPAITVNGKTIRFPVTMKTGMYLELRDGGKCVLYNPQGAPIQDVTLSDPIPTVKKGENSLSVTTESTLPTNARMEVTLIGEGERL